MITIEMRTERGLNMREHHFARAARVKREKALVGWLLKTLDSDRPSAPCVVTLTRIAPSNGLDDDNLQGALKSVRDAVACWLGIDDGDARVGYEYAQERGEWGVRIEWRQA